MHDTVLISTDDSEEIVAAHLDYLHHEAIFVVSPTFEVTAYRTLWFGLQYDSETIEQGETVGNGALATDSPSDVDHFDTFLEYLVTVGFADEKAALQ